MLSAGAKHAPAGHGSVHTRNISTDSLTRNIRVLAAHARESPSTPAAERPALVPSAAFGAGASAGLAAQPPRSEERANSSHASAGREGRAHGWRPTTGSPALMQARRSRQAVHTPNGPESSPALAGTWPLDSPVYRSTVTPDLGAAVQVNLSTIPLARMASPAMQAHSVAEEVWPALSDSMLRYGFSSEHLPDLWQAICERAGAPGKVTPTRRGPAELQSPSERAQSPGVRERNAKLLNARHAEPTRREVGSEQAEDDSASARVLMLSEDSRLQAMSSEHRTLWAQLQALRVEPLRASDAPQQRPAAVSTRSGTSACSAASPRELHSPPNSSGLSSAERRAGLAVHRLAGPAHPLQSVAEAHSTEDSRGMLSTALSCDSLPPGGADPEPETPRAAAACQPQPDRSGAELRCSRMVAGVDPTPTPPAVGTGLPAQSLLTSDATSGSGTSTSHPQPLLLLRQQQHGSGELAPQHRLAARHEPASSPVNTARSTGTVQSAFSAHASRRSSALDSAYGTRTMWSSVSESGAGSGRSTQVIGAAQAKQQYMREVKKLRAKLAREQPDLAPDFRPGVGLADALYSSDLVDDAGERRATARAVKSTSISMPASQSSGPGARCSGRRVSPHRTPGSMQRTQRLSDSQSAAAGPCSRRTGALSPAKSVKRKPRAQGGMRVGVSDSSHRAQLARSPHSSAGPKRTVAVGAGISPSGAKSRARGAAAASAASAASAAAASAAASSLSVAPLGSSSSCVYPSRVRTSSTSSKSSRRAAVAAAGAAAAAAAPGCSARARPSKSRPDARRRRTKVRRAVDPLQTVSELYASDSSRMAPSHSHTFAQHSLRMEGAAAWRAPAARAPPPGTHARAGVPTLSMHRLVADEPDPLTPRRWPQGSALEPEDCPYLLDSARRVTDVMSVASRTTLGGDSDDQLEWSTGQELPDLRLPARSALVPQLRLQPRGSQSVTSTRRRSDGADPMVSPRSAFSRTSSIATDVHSAR